MTQTTDRPISAILSGPEKWCKDHFTIDGKICLTVACTAAGVTVNEITQLRHLVFEKAKQLFPSRCNGTILGFNDHPDTTFDDIRAVLEEAKL